MGQATAFAFPGQGSQSVGMLAALAVEHDTVRATFEAASAVLGFDLWELVTHGPAERLGETVITQPAMLAADVATFRVWRERGGAMPDRMAGHSLGEFSALVCAGSIGFEAAVALVAARAAAMQRAVPPGEGGIAAILGLDDATVEDLCSAVREDGSVGDVWAVNFNAPAQVVIAGTAAAVAAALARAREVGARRAVPLPMSVPVHCALMAPAAREFAPVLAAATFAAPSVPVLHNADVAYHEDGDEIRAVLERQLVLPVRWTAVVASLRACGVENLLECGPGKVLTGLARRIDRTLHASALHDGQSMDAARAALENG